MTDNSSLITAALLKTDPELYEQIDGGSSWKDEIKREGARVKLYGEYEIGDHRANMDAQLRKMLRLGAVGESELEELNINYMEVVVDMEASRLFVSSVTGDDADTGWIEETLQRNRFISEHGQWCREAIRDGDAYVMVDLLGNWISVSAYDGFSGMVVIHEGETGKPLWACKLWSEAKNESKSDVSGAEMTLAVYQKDKITWFSGSEGSAEVTKTDEKAWKPDRLPVISIMNKKDTKTGSGRSELRPAIPINDVLNRSLHSLTIAMELAAFGVKWSIGMEISLDGIVPGGVVGLVLKDASGNIITEPTAEQLEFMKSIQVGQFEATDIRPFLEVINTLVEQIGQVTSTPIRGTTSGGKMSGEALKQLEIGLLGKVERFQRQNTNAFIDLLTLTAEVQNAYNTGLGNAPKLGAIKITWKSAEILDVNARIEALNKQRKDSPGLFDDNFYIEQIGALLGLSQSEINDQKEAAKERQGRAFDALTGADGAVNVI